MKYLITIKWLALISLIGFSSDCLAEESTIVNSAVTPSYRWEKSWLMEILRLNILII